MDTSHTATGSVQNFTMLIEPHQDLSKGPTVTVAAGTWYYGFIDVTAGFTNLGIFATNLPPPSTPPLHCIWTTMSSRILRTTLNSFC